MNSTRRRWQTTGSRAPGATLGLRRRAAAVAPTKPSYLVCARLCALRSLVCITRSTLIASEAARWSEKAGRKNTQDKQGRGRKKNNRSDWWIEGWVCVQYVSMFTVFVRGQARTLVRSVCMFAFIWMSSAIWGWESRAVNDFAQRETVRTDPYGHETYEIWRTSPTAAHCETQVLVGDQKNH